MCLLAIFFRAVPGAHLVIGANREESYDRGGEPPRIFEGPIPALAGFDPTAGGTWCGINARGVVAAVTNRQNPAAPAKARSRGLLTRDLLGCATAKEAVELAIKELSTHRYAGGNLFCGDEERAVVIEGAEWLRVRPLPPGVHVVANRDVNDASDPRVLYALDWLGRRDFADVASCVQALKGLCSQGGGEHPPICLHGEKRGTVSSTIIAVRRPLAESIVWHAHGSPDRAGYADWSGELRGMVGEAGAE